MEFGKQQTSLLATYSQVTGEYGNKPTTTTQVNQPILLLAPSNHDETTATPIRSNAQQQQQQQQRLHRQAHSTNCCTLVESLLNACNRVLSGGTTNVSSSNKRASCLSNCLLGAALFTSVLNTLLLSFVVKTIQFNDVSKHTHTHYTKDLHSYTRMCREMGKDFLQVNIKRNKRMNE